MCVPESNHHLMSENMALPVRQMGAANFAKNCVRVCSDIPTLILVCFTHCSLNQEFLPCFILNIVFNYRKNIMFNYRKISFNYNIGF